MHRGHSISLSSSVNTGSTFCSGRLDSSNVSRAGFLGSGFGGTSLVRPGLDILVFNKIHYYISADYGDGGAGWYRTPTLPVLKLLLILLTKSQNKLT